MSQLSVHDIRGISAYNNRIRVPSGHQLDVEGTLKFPSWTEGTKPAAPEVGLQGWNSELEQLEFYDGTEWQAIISSAIGTASSPATSALDLVANGQTENGVYYIKASASAPAQQVYCILDPAYDGGGWMIVANNAANGTLYNSGHISRVTANTPYVGSTGSNSYSPNFNFSVNCTDFQFNKIVWVIGQTNTSFLGTNGANVNGYINYSWTSKISIPAEQPYWHLDNGLSGFSMGASVSWPGFGAKRMNSDYGGYGQNGSQNYGFGTIDGTNRPPSNAALGTGALYKLVGSGGAYYPSTVTFQGCSANSGNSTAYYCWGFTDSYTNSDPNSAQNGVGFDDWQDGSGLGDQWRCEATNDKSTTRGKPSWIMIK